MQVDPAFEGKAGGAGSLIKYNPLTNMEGTEVWAFLRAFDVPVNALHEQVGTASARAWFCSSDTPYLEVFSLFAYLLIRTSTMLAG